MTDPTPTQDTITARLEDLLAKATPGAWAADDGDADVWGIFQDDGGDAIGYLAEPNSAALFGFQRLMPEQAEANAALIVEAVNALPAILSERATLKAELEEARGAFTKISGIVGDAFNGKLVAPLALDAIDDIAKALTKEATNGR